MNWKIHLTLTARRMLHEIKDTRVLNSLIVRIDNLVEHPEQQSKPLLGELTGYRSLRAVGQRYRIIYKVEKKEIIVLVVALGRRKDGDKKDVYELAKKLIKCRLLD